MAYRDEQGACRVAKAKRATRAKTAKEPDALAVRLVVDLPPDLPTYYANHVELAVNRHEIAMWVARLPTKPGRDQLALAEATGELVVEAEMQILLPPTILEGLIAALVATKTKYEETFGPIREVKE